MDVGCYCVSGARLLAGRARARDRPSRCIGGERRRRARSPARCASPATCSRSFDCGLDARRPRRARGRRRGGALFLDDPWHCASRGSSCAATTASSTIAVEPRQLLPARARELRAAIRGEATPLLGAPTRSARRGRSRRSTVRGVGAQRRAELGRVSVAVGLDVGTSGAKALAVAPDGAVVARAELGYPLSTPRPGWAEQDPEDWWRGDRRRRSQAGAGDVGRHRPVRARCTGWSRSTATSRVLRPAILWNDQRTAAECAEIEAAGRARAPRSR